MVQFSYSQTTHLVRVTVDPTFLESQSSPDDNQYLWAYHIVIENLRDDTIQLLSRCWKIVDSYGRVETVEGRGVVGEFPLLGPGEIYEYTSGTPLSTASGLMSGVYKMESVSSGEKFDIKVPLFSLDSPYQMVTIN